MMGFIHVAVAVLSLLSAGQSTPVTNCESLIEPLDITGREQLLGKWLLNAESTENVQAERIIKTYRDSSWMKITAANESDAIDVINSSKVECFDLCLAKYDCGKQHSPTSPAKHDPEIRDATYKPTENSCSDCLMLLSPEKTSLFGKPARGLLLMSKRRTVTAAEMEEFKKQAECLNLRPPFFSNPEANICPETLARDTENTDGLRFFINGKVFDFMNISKNISNSGLPVNFIKMVSEILSKRD